MMKAVAFLLLFYVPSTAVFASQLFCRPGRLDCAGHGNCTDNGAACVCGDDRWGGDRCHKCLLHCGHGGAPDALCTECVGCGGGYRSRQPAGVPFFAFEEEEKVELVGVDRFLCTSFANALNHAYRRKGDQPPAVAGGACALEASSVFWVLADAAGTAQQLEYAPQPVYEHVSASTGNFYYSSAAAAPPGYCLASASATASSSSRDGRAAEQGSAVFFVPAALEPGAVPVFASHMSTESLEGVVDDTLYSRDQIEGMACSFYDVSVSTEAQRLELSLIKDASYARMVQSWLSKNPLTNPNSFLRVGIGGGVDGARGKLKNLPATYPDAKERVGVG